MVSRESLAASLAELSRSGKELLDLMSDEKNSAYATALPYNVWYTKAIKVVEFLAKDRLQEFLQYYDTDPKRKLVTALNYSLQDYFLGVRAREGSNGKPLWNARNVALAKFNCQLNIVASVETRLDSIFYDVKGVVFAEMLDAELSSARKLRKISLRASGALSGVILERHLLEVAERHSIVVKKAHPTISDLNDILKAIDIVDTATWRKIQYLADVRNICAHNKEIEPTESQVDDLIAGVDELIKRLL